MANVNTSQFSDAIKTEYKSRLLMRALPRLVHGHGGERAVLSKVGSYEWRKYGSMSAITSTLTEAATPAEQAAPSLSLITATPVWYGAWIGHSDVVDQQAIDPLVLEMSAVLGEQAGLSIDTIERNALVSGLTAAYSGSATSTATLDYPEHEINYKDIIKQIATLEAANARPLEGNDFMLILHPHSWASLMNDEVFVNMWIQEGDGKALREGYMGKILRCRIYVTSNAYENADAGVGGTTDVYTAILLGKEAFGVAGMAGLDPRFVDNAGPEKMGGMTGESVKPVDIIVKAVDSGGAENPLNQRGSVGWKVTNDIQILNSAFGIALQHVNMFSDD